MRDYNTTQPATQADVGFLMQRIETLERVIKSLQQNSAPTHPIYDSTNFPQDAVPGQHVQDNNNNLWIYGQDNAWHKISGTANDWVYTQVPLGSIASGVDTNYSMAGSIVHQTDSGDVYDVYPGTFDFIRMKQVGSYLVQAYASVPQGKIGYIEVDAVVGGPITPYDYEVYQPFQAASFPDTTGNTIMGKYGGIALWRQLFVVNNLSSPSGAFLHFTNNTTSTLIAGVLQLSIIRLT